MQRPFVSQTTALPSSRLSGLQHQHVQHAPPPDRSTRSRRWYHNASRISAVLPETSNNNKAACHGPDASIAAGGAEKGAKEAAMAGRRRRRRDRPTQELVDQSSESVKQTGSLTARDLHTTEAAQPPVQQVVGAAPSPLAAILDRTVGNAAQREAVAGPNNNSRRGRRRTNSQSLQHINAAALRVPAALHTAIAAFSGGQSTPLPQTAVSAPASTSADQSTSEASRPNPVLRAIRMMQLRRQQLQNSAAAAEAALDTADVAGLGVPYAAIQQQVGFQQDQEQLQESRGAATAARLPTDLQRPRAALPADEVLVTETSHMNPVYRRIRLQELRLKLQRRLQGPQPQQLQQHQQQLPGAAADVRTVASGSQVLAQQRQKPRAALPAEEVFVTEASHLNPVYRRIRLQELRLRLQQQQTLPGQRQADSSRSTLAANSSRSSSSSETSTQSRGPTQGLNSVQRAIRMAELQRLLQQRHETGTPVGTRGTRSRAGAAAGSAAGAAPTPWFLEDSTTGLYSRNQGYGSRNTRHQQTPSIATAATASDAQTVMQQLIAAGVSAAAASEAAGLGAPEDAAGGLGSQSSPVLGRISQLQELLGLSSVASAAKIVIKQPNLLKRDPQTLRHNLNDMCEILQLPPAKVQKVLAAYPPALDMSPATVASKVATLTATLNVPASQAVKVACTCPRMLGLSSEMLICKVSDLQSALELPSKVAAVDVILGFPSVLGLSTERLAVKYQQLKTLAQQRRDWQQQLLHLRQHKPGSLGRVLAAGPRVVDRLKYLLDAGEADQTLDNSRGGSSIRDFYDSSSISCQHQAAEDRGRRMTKSSVCKGGFAGGNLAALLIMSEGTFMNLHPEFGLWRLEQRSTVPIKYA